MIWGGRLNELLACCLIIPGLLVDHSPWLFNAACRPRIHTVSGKARRPRTSVEIWPILQHLPAPIRAVLERLALPDVGLVRRSQGGWAWS